MQGEGCRLRGAGCSLCQIWDKGGEGAGSQEPVRVSGVTYARDGGFLFDRYYVSNLVEDERFEGGRMRRSRELTFQQRPAKCEC